MSSVAVHDDLVYAADLAGRIYCLDAITGALQWRHETKDEIWGNPLVADGKVYVNARRSFWILAAGRERKVLFSSRGGSECGPIAANGVVYAFIRGKLYANAVNDKGENALPRTQELQGQQGRQALIAPAVPDVAVVPANRGRCRPRVRATRQL